MSMGIRSTILLACVSLILLAEDSSVPYPEGYRGWTFLHASMVSKTFGPFEQKPCNKPCTSGVFYFYANPKAMDGLRTGTYADGAVIAEEMLEFHADERGFGKEGPRRMVGVMVRDSARFAATGGWGYGAFDESGTVNRLDAAAQKACYTCHIPRKDKGYVFTEYHQR